MIKLYICCLVLIIGSVEVGPDIDMKFHQEVMEIVSYDIFLWSSGNLLVVFWQSSVGHQKTARRLPEDYQKTTRRIFSHQSMAKIKNTMI